MTLETMVLRIGFGWTSYLEMWALMSSLCYAWQGVELCFTWHEQNGKSKMQTLKKMKVFGCTMTIMSFDW